MIGDETLTLLRPTVTGEDGYGNDVFTDAEVALPSCQVQARASSEDVNARDQVVSGLFVYAPPMPAVKATDRVRRGPAGSLVFEVDGDIGVWPEGALAGQEFALRRVTG